MATLNALKSTKKLVLSQEWTDEEDVHVKLHLEYFLQLQERSLFGLQYRAVQNEWSVMTNPNDPFWNTYIKNP